MQCLGYTCTAIVRACLPICAGLAAHQNLVELHLFAAELAANAPLGPLGLTFCTVDFWTCDTKMSALAEGALAVPL